jgi:hypothetical protein
MIGPYSIIQFSVYHLIWGLLSGYPFSRPRYPIEKNQTSRYPFLQTGLPDLQIGIPSFWSPNFQF